MSRRATVEIDTSTALLIGGGVLGLLWLMNRGVSGVAEDIAHGAVSAAGGAAAGAVGAVGEQVGLPPLREITTDRYVSRYIIDHPSGGQLAASAWSSVWAFVRAQWLDAGSGHYPIPGSAIAQAFPRAEYDLTHGIIDMGSPGGF